MVLFIPALQRYSNEWQSQDHFHFKAAKRMKITWLVTKKNLLNLLWVIWDGALPELRVRIAYICIRAGDGPWVSDPAGQLHQQRRFLMKPFRAWNNSLSNGLIKQLAKIHQEVHVKKTKKNPVRLNMSIFSCHQRFWVQRSDRSPHPGPCSRELSFMHFVFCRHDRLSLWVFTCLY